MWYDRHCHWHFDFNMTVKQFPIFQLLDHIKKKHLQFPILFVITEKDSGMAKDLIFLSSDSSNKKKKSYSPVAEWTFRTFCTFTLLHHFAEDRKCTSFSQKQRVAWAMVMFVSWVSSSSLNKSQKSKELRV